MTVSVLVSLCSLTHPCKSVVLLSFFTLISINDTTFLQSLFKDDYESK